jgi:hypothetical protein
MINQQGNQRAELVLDSVTGNLDARFALVSWGVFKKTLFFGSASVGKQVRNGENESPPHIPTAASMHFFFFSFSCSLH